MRKTLESYPNLVKEFDFKKNTPFTPKDFSFGSEKKICWKCIKGHEWDARVHHRTYGKNCPFCSGKKVSKENNLKFLFPKIAKEWHPTKNNNLNPETVTKSSSKKVWWKCRKKGHEWIARVSSRTYHKSRTNCPHCLNVKRKNFIK